MTYPSGQVVSYARDAGGHVTSVGHGAAGSLASGVSHLPFGPGKALTLGNGIAITRTFDLAYRMTGITQGGAMNRSYGYDAAGNITAITDQIDPARDQVFAYDALHRLTEAAGVYGDQVFFYDPVGNRIRQDHDAATTSYGYAANSNRLTAIDAQPITYDQVGNTTDNGQFQFSYDERNRMVEAADGAQTLADYDYNGRGERVRKTAGATTTYFIFDQNGLLIAEADSAGTIQREYVYLDGERLAVVEGTSALYFHNDHLGTPQALTDGTGAVVWQGDFEPFGTVYAESGTESTELRFPGQYFDAETGLHYNYFRDYDPGIGRYVQSDPIGLDGGLNIFLYSHLNPSRFSDPLGLKAFSCWGKLRTYHHKWICVDGSCAGLMPSGGMKCESGVVQPEKFEEKMCREINVDSSCDQKKYESCLLEHIENVGACDEYGLFTRNCVHWANETFRKCNKVACGSEDPPAPFVEGLESFNNK